ncbi:MAG: YihY/virulence factor BrkB family protein [Bacteroides sp.]|jgi:membrane protein|nr:YihY/virulence factor BrkB family protein [Bacteroides sp.]
MTKTKKSLGERILKGIHFLEKDIWQIPLRELPRRKYVLIKHLRIFMLALRGFNEDKVAMRASALTYYTLFSIVPFVGLAFGIAKGFGLDAFLENQLETALSGREEVLHWILSFSKSILQTTSGGLVAGVGLIILLYTIFQVMRNIELSFNDIWQVNKARDWTRMLSDYFAMMFITPLFLIMSSAATVFINTQVSQFSNNLEFLSFLSPVLLFLVRLVPYLLIWLMLSILYMVMPNTKVKFSSALVAGIIAGTLFQLVQWGYIFFQIGVSRYNAIYGSFAALPLLLMWMQISWLVVLLGAEISYAYQNVENYEFDVESQNISFLNKQIISVYVMLMLVSHFKNGLPPPDSSQIAHKLEIPNKLVRSVLNDLGDVNLVSEVQLENNKDTGYQPALDINQISLQLVLERLERRGIDFMVVKKTKSLEQIREALTAIGKKIETSDHNLLLKDLESIEA